MCISSYLPNYFSKILVDDKIPDNYSSRWRSRLHGLPKLSKFSIHRHVKTIDLVRITSSQIHHFCDANQSAYGAVSYVCLVNSDGRIHCFFLIGKSSLAPLKQTTIPRLELAAATVSIRLNKILNKELKMPIDTITFSTDSMTEIHYIENKSKGFHNNVASGVAVIREDYSSLQ